MKLMPNFLTNLKHSTKQSTPWKPNGTLSKLKNSPQFVVPKGSLACLK
jgi:hypothetical protein